MKCCFISALIFNNNYNMSFKGKVWGDLMERELYGITQDNVSELNNSISLEFYLLTETACIENIDTTVYGVEINRIENAKNNKTHESAAISNVWLSRQVAENFIQLLVDCKVRPVHLKDIVEDFVGLDISYNRLQTA